VLTRVAQLLAPVTPFVAERVYRTLVGERSKDAALSVHLTSFPTPDAALQDREVEAGVALVRKVLSVGLAARNTAQIKVRQPLSRAVVAAGPEAARWLREFDDDLRDELNVEAVELAPEVTAGGGVFVSASEGGVVVALDTTLTPELREKGVVRQLTHQVQVLRKSAGLNVEDRIRLFVATDDSLRAVVQEYREYVAEEALVAELVFASPPPGAAVQAVALEGGPAVLGVSAVTR
jgi:isoleucyl-tRNA synthetase